MKSYVVIYTEADCADWLFFRCDAEDANHAEEQCDNAYPGCVIIGVYEGRTADEALAAMQDEIGCEAT